MLSLLLISTSADAARMPLEPQNRLHLGVAAMNGTESYGLTFGMDSRLTRFFSIDLGGFFSASEAPVLSPSSDSTIEEWVTMRHGIWFAPGLRVPHGYNDGLNWDVFFRSGFGTIWSQDASADYDSLFDVALIGGLDFMLRRDNLGMRLSGKGFVYKTYPSIAWKKDWEASELLVISPQVSLEAVYQF